ncbi:MAG: amidohydrolase family protein [Thermoanaerobaculaceae bacterium]|jgi:dihydropyrimidinase|nr:amidohydrolase family protein [Thermoanaerobaculaceae bacterium]
MALLIANGLVHTGDGVVAGDVLVRRGRVAAVGADLAPLAAGARVIDAGGLPVVPGLIDFHVHADDEIGPFTLADDLASASRVAIANGITTIVAFATQRTGESLADTAARYLAKVPDRSWCDVAFHLTPTGDDWDWAALARLPARGFRTIKLYTTYRQAGLYSSWDRLAAIMPRLAELGLRLLLHCEDDALLAAVDPGQVDLCDPFSHTLMRPPRAEVAAIEHAIALARDTGCPLHVVHVSTPDGASAIAAARRHHEVSGETCPQYLLLSDQSLRLPGGHRLLCSPPLRAEADRARLEAMTGAGALDVLATDHCPFRRTEKDRFNGDYRSVPNGVPGLGALVPLMHGLWVDRHGRPLEDLVRLLAINPARLAGLGPRKGVIREGADADLVVLDPSGPERPVCSTLADAHDPWSGRTTRLSCRHVLLRGVEVVRDGVLLDAPARGRACQGPGDQ